MDLEGYARYEYHVAEDKLGRSVLEVIELAEQRQGVNHNDPDYVPVYDQN